MPFSTLYGGGSRLCAFLAWIVFRNVGDGRTDLREAFKTSRDASLFIPTAKEVVVVNG